MKKLHKDILDTMHAKNSADGDADNFMLYPTIGIVINTDDPLENGRLQVFCAAYGDNPKKMLHLPWCSYGSPFGGTIKNTGFTRGVKDGPENTTGAVSYGFWAIPEHGSHVIVMCIDNDPRRRVWMGSIYENQETHTLHHGRFDWGNGFPDGPLSSEKEPIQPLYDNMSIAFKGDKSSREWKTRGAEYQGSSINENEGQIPNDSKPTYLDNQYEQISEAEEDEWVKPILGSHGYDWTSYKALGAHKSSKVYGFSSPGMHAFTMDDRAFNNRTRIRSATGHQILLDDTNERIYIQTNKGKTFLEMDSSGNIDVFGERRMSFTADLGFNFNTKDTFRVYAEKGIHMYAGKNNEQDNLPNAPEDGEIRIHSTADMHLITEKVMRQLSIEDTKIEIGGNKCETIGISSYLQVQNDINILNNEGNYYLTVSGDLHELVQANAYKMALGEMRNMSNGNAQMHSFKGKMDVGAQKTISCKSVSEDIALESVGMNAENNGCVVMKSPNSQYGVTSEGVFTSTSKKIVGKADERVEFAQDTTKQNEETGAEDPGACDIGETVDTEGYTGADLAARLAYNAGFRGADLVTAVAIAGGESGYDVYAQNDADGRPEKWGGSYGLWQIRTLQNPEEWEGIDRQRDPNVIGGPENVQNNANLSYDIFNRSQGFREWGAYTNGSYLDWMDQAQAATNSMCAGVEPLLMADSRSFDNLFGVDLPQLGCGKSLMSIFEPLIATVNQAQNLISMVAGSTNIQVTEDINIKGLDVNISTKIFDKMIPKINELTDKLNKTCQQISSWMQEHIINAVFGETIAGSPAAWAATALSAARVVAALADFPGISFPTVNILLDLADLGLDFEKFDFDAYKLPQFDYDIWAVFDLGNHDGCTLLDLGGFKLSQAPTR